jgi:hypothetical protein
MQFSHTAVRTARRGCFDSARRLHAMVCGRYAEVTVHVVNEI